MEHEPKLKDVWAKIPTDTDVLITHGPAYGTHDLVKNSASRDPHVGSKELAIRKKELPNLKVHISGHIHESAGISTDNNIINICASVLNEHYKITNDPIVIDVKNIKDK